MEYTTCTIVRSLGVVFCFKTYNVILLPEDFRITDEESLQLFVRRMRPVQGQALQFVSLGNIYLFIYL